MATLMSVCVIQLQPGLACLGKPCSVRSVATPGEGLPARGHSALVWGISHQRGSWGQRLAFLPAAILEDVLVIADNAKARMSIRNSMLTYHQAPSECATELTLQLLGAAASPRPSLNMVRPFAGLELAGLGYSQHQSGVTSALLTPSFGAASQASPGTRWPSLSLWTHSLCRVKLHLKLSNILYMCFMYKNKNICFDCLFL